MMRTNLNLSREEFYAKIFDWAREFKFKIDGDYIFFETAPGTEASFVQSLEQEFIKWEQTAEKAKAEKVIPLPEGIYSGIRLQGIDYQFMKELEQLIGEPIPHGIAAQELNRSPVVHMDQHGVSFRTQFAWFEAIEGHVSFLCIEGFKNLTYLPRIIGLLPAIKGLKLGSNAIKELPDTIGNLTALERFDIYANQLISLPNSIGQLKSLKRFNVCNNRFRVLPDNIQDLQSIREFSIGGNKDLVLNDAQKSWFLDIRRRGVDVEHSEVEIEIIEKYNGVPVFASQYSILRELEQKIGSPLNPVDDIDDSTGGGNKFSSYYWNVTGLTISDARLESLPANLGDLYLLTRLDVVRCGLKQVPNSIGRLKKLFRLKLSANALKILPETIGELSDLRGLVLEENAMEYLPDSIGQLLKLEGMVLRENRLTVVPSTIGKLAELNHLELQGNLLRSLPTTIGNLRNLSDLILSRNKLESLPPELFNTKISYLNLDNNCLHEVPASIGDSNVHQISLQFNPLNDLPRSCLNLKIDLDITVDDNQARGAVIRELISRKFRVKIVPRIGDQIPEEELNRRANELVNYRNEQVYYPEYVFLKAIEGLIEEKIKKFESLSAHPSWLEGARNFYNMEEGHIIKIDLSDCKIQTFPVSIKFLRWLKDLNLNCTGLEEVPESIGQLVTLRKLILWGNNLKSIPSSFKNLIELEVLSLTSNLFKQVPDIILHLPKLKILYVDKVFTDSPIVAILKKRKVKVKM